MICKKCKKRKHYKCKGCPCQHRGFEPPWDGMGTGAIGRLLLLPDVSVTLGGFWEGPAEQVCRQPVKHGFTGHDHD